MILHHRRYGAEKSSNRATDRLPCQYGAWRGPKLHMCVNDVCFKYIYLRVIAPTSEKSEIGIWTFQTKRNDRERAELAMWFTSHHALLRSCWWPGEATAPLTISLFHMREIQSQVWQEHEGFLCSILRLQIELHFHSQVKGVLAINYF